MDPFKDVNAFNVAIALKEACKFVDTGLVPSFGNGTVRMFDKIAPRSKFFEVLIPDASASIGSTDRRMVKVAEVVKMSKVTGCTCIAAG